MVCSWNDLWGAWFHLFLPKKLPELTAAYCFLIGPFLGMIFDHTIAVPPLDLYDVGDEAIYSLFVCFPIRCTHHLDIFLFIFMNALKLLVRKKYGILSFGPLWQSF